MNMKPYLHTVQYYETDMMGIVHHSNYIRFMEEARIDFLNQLGFPYQTMEAAGIFSPVTALSCTYRHPLHFGEHVSVCVSVAAFDGVRMDIQYQMENEAGQTVCSASSSHVFLHRDGHFARIRRELPAFSDAIASLLSEKDH